MSGANGAKEQPQNSSPEFRRRRPHLGGPLAVVAAPLVASQSARRVDREIMQGGSGIGAKNLVYTNARNSVFPSDGTQTFVGLDGFRINVTAEHVIED